MLRAVRYAGQIISVKFVTLHDGPLTDNPSWSSSLRGLVEPVGELIELPRQNNSLSCLDAIYRASEHGNEELIIFAEDDYFWLEPSLKGMCSALTQLPADYVTAYDHPVRYQPDYPLGADWPHWHTTIHLTAERHWRSQESTCMTFGAKAATIRQDLLYFERYHDNGKNVPDDRRLFRHLCGLGSYEEQDNPHRILLGPIPSLNTHLHLPWLAPLINWEAEARAL
jgi:hypothetical protein